MRVSYTFNDADLLRTRYLRVIRNYDPQYAIKPNPIYDPIRRFFATYQNSGYSFRLEDLLNATAVKMFERTIQPQQLRRRIFQLFATAGLYLALDIRHPDLAIREQFGDFTAGFSHQFGVGLSALVMSQVFGIPWDQMNRIRVSGGPVLDYEAEIPSGGRLLFEAKGVSRSEGRSHARRSICDKKQASSGTASISTPQIAMVGIIIQCARSGQIATKPGSGRQGLIEIIDPDFGNSDVVSSEERIHAGMYRHYAGAAMFAGLYDVAEELLERANALIQGKSRNPQGQYIRFNDRDVLQVEQRNLVGVQWRPSDQAELTDDVWFYQAIDRDIIRELIVNDVFPHTQPYSYDQPARRNREFVESLVLATWDIRSETRRLHQSDFPFLSLPSGKRHRTARGMENRSSSLP
jgi:hypothetical protein